MTTEDKSQKTEKPTRKKLRDVREKGSVTRSREIVSTSIIVAVFIFFWLGWQNQLDVFQEIIVISTTLFDTSFEHALTRMLDLLLSEFYIIVFPFAAMIIVVGVLANVLQFGVLFSTEPVKPKFERINPIAGFKRVFSIQNLFETVKVAIKVTVVAVVLYLVLKNNMQSLVRIPHCGFGCLKEVLEHLAAQIVIYIVPFFVFLSIVDYIVQKRLYLRSHMMAKHEIRRERKDMEGDPHILGQRKQLHQQMVTGGIVEAMQQASLVLTAGDDLAVVLFYEKDETPLPVVSAIERYQAARLAVEMARDSDTAVEENFDLATELARQGKVGQYIPSNLIDDVAKALQQTRR